MTERPETPLGAEETQRTTWMRRYTLDPGLALEFVEFLRTEVFPAREQRGFTVESVWLSEDSTELTWFVSRFGTPEEFAAADRDWEESDERAKIFSGRPKYVLGKDLQRVTRLR